MRRPINWVVVCLSLLFLAVSLTSGGRAAPPVESFMDTPAVARFDFARAVAAEPDPPQFGYIDVDGSFLPLTSASPSSR